MRRYRSPLASVCAALMLSGPVIAQNAVQVEPPKGGLGWVTRPYREPQIGPADLSNSTRLEKLIQGGNLYLSAQDVIALALENNLDIEIQRYGPVLSREVLRRAEGGGILRNVGVGVAQGPTSVSLQGVNVNASGGTGAGVTGAGVSSGGGIITQLGPSIPNLDPHFSFVANFSHSTSSGEQHFSDRHDCVDRRHAHLSGTVRTKPAVRDELPALVLEHAQQVQQQFIQRQSVRQRLAATDRHAAAAARVWAAR